MRPWAFCLGLLACQAAVAPGAGGAETVLIPRETDRWDRTLRRAVAEIRRGELRSGIQALQQVVENAGAAASLKAVPPGFQPPAPGSGMIVEMDPEPAIADADPEPAEDIEPADDDDERDPLLPVVRRRPSPQGVRRPVETLYLPAAEVARQLLAGLPPQGVQAYEALYGALAERRLRRARELRDAVLLERVALDLALTPAGREALEALAETAFEEGRILAALTAWKTAFDRASGERRLELQLRVLGALRLLGRSADYEAEKKAFLANASAKVDTELYLERLKALDAVPAPAAAPGVAVAPGQSPGPPPVLPGRRMTFDWNSGFWARRGVARIDASSPSPFERRAFMAFDRETYSTRSYPFFPSLSPDGGHVYVGGVFSLHRLSAATGKIERPPYTQPPSSASARAPLLTFLERSDSPVYTVSILPPQAVPEAGSSGARPVLSRPGSGGMLVSSYLSDLVPFRHYMGYEITADIPTRSLAGHDIDSGALLWRTGDITVGLEKKPISFTTPVLASGGRIFAGGWQQHGYLDAILAAFDPANGALLWSELIVSSQMEGTMFGELAREPFASVLAEREGIIYYVTNLGALAAVHGATGQVQWLVTYDTIEVKPADIRRDLRRSDLRRMVWGLNPPLFAGDTLIVTPRDSTYLYAIDCPSSPQPGREPGRILWKYQNSGGELRDLLGAVPAGAGKGSGGGSGGVRLYFTGPKGVQALELQDGRPPRRIPGPIHRSDDGRGALTDAGVLVVAPADRGVSQPGRGGGDERLWLVDLDMRGPTDLSGPLPRSDLGSHGGNVTVGLGRVFLTSRELVASLSVIPEPADLQPAQQPDGRRGAPRAKPDAAEEKP